VRGAISDGANRTVQIESIFDIRVNLVPEAAAERFLSHEF
jgi:hypothetical protein